MSIINRIFGPKVHKKFPRKIRLSNGDCSGLGTYPSEIGGGGPKYWADGIDLEIEVGEVVCFNYNCQYFLLPSKVSN